MADSCRIVAVQQSKNAIISVSKKDGLEKIGKFLISQNFNLYGTSGTREFLRSHEVNCEAIEKITGVPEILGGRVKTLSSSLLAGVLAFDREDPDLHKYNYMPIDLVYVEPYDFIGNYMRGIKDLVEFIDIGGITLIRAAAKNYQRVIVVPGKQHMDRVMNEMKSGDVPEDLRKSMAADAFKFTSLYDYAIANWLGGEGDVFTVGGTEYVKLRYGENPHQSAHSYSLFPPFFDILKVGKEVSFNNIIDAWTAWELVIRLGEGSASVVKHAAPCGAAVGKDALKRAYESDPVSAYGGILAFNGKITSEHGAFLKDKYLEVIIAQDFENEAFESLNKKKNIRLLRGREDAYSVPDVRSAGNVLLVQEWNRKSPPELDVRSGNPTEDNIRDVRFGWDVVKSIKSNSVAIVRDGWLLSSGGGQPNRVDSVKLAIARAKESGRLDSSSVLVSDGFFPFVDSIEYIEKNGIRIVATPMGSIRDKEVSDYSSEKGLVLIEVKERAFRH